MSRSAHPPFFIVSCARSGSTSLCAILDEAVNGRCVSEPVPNLNRETREMMEGRLHDPAGVLECTIVPRVLEGAQGGAVYGEKNVTYAPFIPHLYARLGCRFVYLKRDGREVVRSLLNWHENKFGSIYRECKEPGTLSPEALAAAGALPVHLDTSDYSRPRPPMDHPLAARWEDLTRAEMCAFYWAFINDLYLDGLERLPEEAWIEIDYSAVTAESVEHVARYCGLQGLERVRVQQMLDERINSLQARGGAAGTYPDWKWWDSGQRRRYDAIAAPAMRRLGYYGEQGTEWRPKRYGDWWSHHEGGLDWYTWMYESRKHMHEDLLRWIAQRDAQGDDIGSVLDLGCGLGVGYAEALAAKRYVGVDLSPRNVEWCQHHRSNPRHAYRCADFVTEVQKETFDLVFSSGTLDNCYDIDAALRSMVRQSRKWLYLTCYRGWFGNLREHRYQWSDEHTCFYNDASPDRIRDVLQEERCRDISIEPVAAGPDARDIPFETRVIARVPD